MRLLLFLKIQGSIPDELTKTTVINYEDIPHFPKSTVHGHAGRLVFGLMSGVEVMCMQGRIHFYEGYPLATVSFQNLMFSQFRVV